MGKQGGQSERGEYDNYNVSALSGLDNEMLLATSCFTCCRGIMYTHPSVGICVRDETFRCVRQPHHLRGRLNYAACGISGRAQQSPKRHLITRNTKSNYKCTRVPSRCCVSTPHIKYKKGEPGERRECIVTCNMKNSGRAIKSYYVAPCKLLWK